MQVYQVGSDLTIHIFYPAYLLAQQNNQPTPSDVIRQVIFDFSPKLNQPQTPILFSNLVRVTIAINEIKGWKSPEADQIRDLLKDEKSKLFYSGMEKLLSNDDLAAAVAMYTIYKGLDGYPPPNEVDKSVELLKAAKYTLAANTLSALNPELTKRRIVAWLSIPTDKRKVIDDYMLAAYAPTNLNRRFLVSIGVELYTGPPANAPLTADDYFKFITWF